MDDVPETDTFEDVHLDDEDKAGSVFDDVLSLDKWDESKHPRDEEGQFSKSDTGSQKAVAKKNRHGRIKKQRYLNLPKEEYARVHTAFFSQMSTEDKGKRVVNKYIGDYLYTGIRDNAGLWRFIEKEKIK